MKKFSLVIACIFAIAATSFAGNIYFNKNGFANLNQIYRINPEVVYNFGKLTVGLEYQYTAVQYGDTFNNKGLATENLHWVANNRIQSIVRFNF